MSNDYGLELTNNSKTSWAFSLPRSKTCVSATNLCKKLCYGNGIRYQSKGQKEKRERNYRTVELLLSKFGPEKLAENLIELIDRAKPPDWLTARVTGNPPKTPWTLRIHDVGDFHSVEYIQAWQKAIEQRPSCSFWFYTRSFDKDDLFTSLSNLVLLKNCKGWLSIDSENFRTGLLAYAKGQGRWNVALMQENESVLNSDLLPALTDKVMQNQVVAFPVHRAGTHAKPISHAGLVTCPAVIGAYRLEPETRKVRPCQACTFCLPGDYQ